MVRSPFRWFVLGVLAGWVAVALALGAFLWIAGRQIRSESADRHADEVARRVESTKLRPPVLELAELGSFDYSWKVEWGPERAERDFEALRGRVVVLSFWATWCVPCFAEFPALSKLADSFPEEDLVVISVAMDDEAPYLAFLREGRYPPPGSVARLGREGSATLWPRALPTTWIVAPNGSIVARHDGAADWGDATVARFARELLARAPAPAP